ncbi:MAG TPA: hypothetical protein VM406_05710 [Noviherbaspirillum sp.]|nr:hypothetical protein [Noviherbaspirillum sp.]
MTRRFRTFLLCLLMAALPLQGLAAVMKAACAPEQHALHHGAVKHEQCAECLTAEGSQSVDRSHHHHAASHHGADASPGSSASSGSLSLTDGTCSVCAVCHGAAVAPPVAVLNGLADHVGRLAAPMLAPLLASFIPAGLERPPRYISA